MLETGQPAPDFAATNQSGETIRLSDFAGNSLIVLYFYPKDDTPGCTIEANQFTTLVEAFSTHEARVFGVSKDSEASHQQFIDKFNLHIDLLADTRGELCEAYGVWQEKEKKGVKKMGIVRSTFVIDKEGALVHVEYGVSPDGHAQSVLDIVRNL